MAVVRPWAAGEVAVAALGAPHPGLPTPDFDAAIDTLMEAALHSAVVAPTAEARQWFAHAGDGLSRLLGRGEAVELGGAGAGLRWCCDGCSSHSEPIDPTVKSASRVH